MINPPAAACVIIYSITPLAFETLGPLYIACPALAYSAFMLLVQCGLSRFLAYMATPPKPEPAAALLPDKTDKQPPPRTTSLAASRPPPKGPRPDPKREPEPRGRSRRESRRQW